MNKVMDSMSGFDKPEKLPLNIESVLRENIYAFEDELTMLTAPTASNKVIGERLMFLFQKELLPSLAGKALTDKVSREGKHTKAVKWYWKLCGWIFVALVNAAMIFYIFLFSLQLSMSNRSAWLKSFAMWFIADVLFISTFAVLITHFVIPWMSMRDVQAIKKRVLGMLVTVREEMKSNTYKKLNPADFDPTKFNACEWMMLSYRLARHLPDHPISQLILRFHTTVPPHVFSGASEDLKSVYSSQFSFLTSSATVILVFLVDQFMRMHSSFQDIFLQEAFAVASTCVMSWFIQLYMIHPALVLVPIVLVAALVHFLIQGSKTSFKDSSKVSPGPVESTSAKSVDALRSEEGNVEVVVMGGELEAHPFCASYDDRIFDNESVVSLDYERLEFCNEGFVKKYEKRPAADSSLLDIQAGDVSDASNSMPEFSFIDHHNIALDRGNNPAPLVDLFPFDPYALSSSSSSSLDEDEKIFRKFLKEKILPDLEGNGDNAEEENDPENEWEEVVLSDDEENRK